MELRHNNSTIKYTLNPSVFNLLSENFCLIENPIYSTAKKDGYITFTKLVTLSRSAGLPYQLFFASYDKVNDLIEKQNKELFGALDERYIIGSRGQLVDIRWIRRIVLDLSRKQKTFNKYRPTQRLDNIVGYLKNSKHTLREQSDYILSSTGIDIGEFRSYSRKANAFNYLREVLSKNNIHVSVEARSYMPQSIPEQIKGIFSGVYIRDPKNPYLFICNELSGSPEIGSGRKIYTLLFLLVCLFKDKSYAISINRNTYSVDKKKFKQLAEVHDIVNEILIPFAEIPKGITIDTYAQVEKMSRDYNITPKAVLQRMYDTRIISKFETYKRLSDECAEKFAEMIISKNKKGHSGSPGAEVMIAYYQGDFLSFLKTYIPKSERAEIARRHILFNRLHYRIDM